MSEAVDDLVGMTLLVYYVRQRANWALPDLQDIAAGAPRPSPYGVYSEARKTLTCPLLKAVFDPRDRANLRLIPPQVLADWLESVADLDIGQPQHRVPMSLFGQFHQLCVSKPLEDTSGRPSTGNRSTQRELGVYYTPPALVDFLVGRTLAPAMSRFTPDQLGAVRILEPSCGCGGFLIAALRYVLAWLEGAYSRDECASAYARTRTEKRNLAPQAILDLAASLLYGFDIDRAAVDWTIRLILLTIWESSLAECWKGDSRIRFRMPDLHRNIVCANFLVMEKYPSRPLNSKLGEGADVILGSPPFAGLRQLCRKSHKKVSEYRSRFITAQSGHFDLYVLFLEKAVALLRPGGWLGMGVSSTFLRCASGRRLRSLLAEHCRLEEIVEFQDSSLYPDAKTNIALVIAKRTVPAARPRHVWIKGKSNIRRKLDLLYGRPIGQVAALEIRELPSCSCHSEDWLLASAGEAQLLAKLDSAGVALGRLPIESHHGITTGDDEVFLLRPVAGVSGRVTLVEQRKSGKRFQLESAGLRPILRARDIRGFSRPSPKHVCVFPYDSQGRLLNLRTLRVRFRRIHDYLASQRPRLAARKRRGQNAWYALQNAPLGVGRGPLLIAGAIDSGRGFTLRARTDHLCHSSVLTIRPTDSVVNPLFLLGVLNSALFWLFARHHTPTVGEGRHVYKIAALRAFPLVLPLSKCERSASLRITGIVRRILRRGTAESDLSSSLSALDDEVNGLYGVADLWSECANMEAREWTP